MNDTRIFTYGLVEQVRVGSRVLCCIHLWYPVSQKQSMHNLPWILREFLLISHHVNHHILHIGKWHTDSLRNTDTIRDVYSGRFCWFQVVWITTPSTFLVYNIDSQRHLHYHYHVSVMSITCSVGMKCIMHPAWEVAMRVDSICICFQ